VQDKDGNTMLHHAAKKTNIWTVEKIAAIDPSQWLTQNNDGDTPIAPVLSKEMR